MRTFEVLCLLFVFVGFFLILASGIYPRVEDNCWCILFVLVSGLYWIDGGVLCSFFMRMHSVQVILNSRISKRFL